MARITIYDKSGTPKVNSHGDRIYGKMKYVGQTMSISYLEFNVASPYPIAWNVGDYVDYGAGLIGTRNIRFMLFTIPQPRKDAEGGLYGGGFVYSGVQFHDLGQILTLAPFTDMQVENDNLIHYSTRSGLSTFENVAGILARLQACADAFRLSLGADDPMKGAKFYFRLCTRDTTAAHLTVAPNNTLGGEDIDKYEELINEARAVTIDGFVLDGMNDIQNVWPAIGWDMKFSLCDWYYDYDAYNRITHAEDLLTGIAFNYFYRSATSRTPSSIKDEWGQEVGTLPERIVFVTIGAVNFVSNAGASAEFKRNDGLVNLRKYITNQDSFLTRLVAYGSERNLPGRYYNGKDILNADSVDIPNLMLPISTWGKTSGLPDARKAFIENSNTVSKFGVIPRIVRFDNNENGEIYPTIKGLTVGDLRDYIAAGSNLPYPPDSSWGDDVRIDEILGVTPDIIDSSITTFDSGYQGVSLIKKSTHWEEDTGRGNTIISSSDIGKEESYSPGLGVGPIRAETSYSGVVLVPTLKNVRVEIYFGPASTGGADFVSAYLSIGGQWSEHGSTKNWKYGAESTWPMLISADAQKATINIGTMTPGPDCPEVNLIDSGSYVYTFLYYNFTIKGTAVGTVYFRFKTVADFSIGINNPIASAFRLAIPPFGYDLTNIETTEGEVKIAMVDGACAGREFVATACVFGSGNGITLSVNREYDESLSQYFPNADYPVVEGDHFVILGVAMPEVYITAAESRLYAKALAYYSRNSKLRHLYDLELDSKHIHNQGLTFHPGMYMQIVDSDLIGANPEYVLIDTVTITENDSNIPVYKVTLREKLYLPE